MSTRGKNIPNTGPARPAPKRIAAPPVYRPSPTPLVLQAKSARSGGLQPATSSNTKKTPVAPPVYHPQPVTKVMQAKISTIQRRSAPGIKVVNTRAPLPVNQKWPNSRTIQRAEEEVPVEAQVAAAVEEKKEIALPAEPLLEEKEGRKGKAAKAMDWTKFVMIGLPSEKHILELMSTSKHVGGAKKVSVVELAVAQDAVKKIGEHVSAHGWVSGPGFVFEWKAAHQCWIVTYKENEWVTHTNTGQLWPLCGKDVFTPIGITGAEIKKFIKQWQSSKERRPRAHMGKKVELR